MSESTQEPGPEETNADGPTEAESGDTLSEEDYALGSTSDPDGAERGEPAGGDYAGSGF